MAIEQTEEELNIKRKARRRLIGAVALTLAVVVILPMVLDSEPKPSGQDIDLRIPASDQAGEFEHGAALLSGTAAGSGAASASAATAPIVAPAAVVAAKPVEPHVAPQHVKEHAAAKPEPVAKKQAEPPAKAKSAALEGYVAQVGAYANADAARHELEKLKKWGFTAYTEKAGDKIRVRVGPYSDRSKAEHARHQLEKHGLQAVVLNAK